MSSYFETQREKEQARKDARDISNEQAGEMMDAWVLGYFDWRDWFDDKPSNTYLRELYNQLQLREECME